MLKNQSYELSFMLYMDILGTKEARKKEHLKNELNELINLFWKNQRKLVEVQ
jgi:hypothetical protein